MSQRDIRSSELFAHVHALTVLGEAGSFTAAAQRLGLSKAAMSQWVAELERAAGVPLVHRTTRSVQLTEAGRQLAESTRPAFAQIDEAFVGVKNLAAEPSGLVRVTAPVALARQHIVPLLPAFLQRYPAVRLELDMSDRLRPLAAEGLDLAIRHTSTPPETVVAWRLRETRSVLAASPDYLARHGYPEHPADLRRHACLYYPRGGDGTLWSFDPAVPTASAEAGVAISVEVRGPLAANNSEALREAAVAGLGVAMLPDFSADAALADGRLVAVMPAWKPHGAYGSHLWALRPQGAQVPRAVRVLVDWLRERLAQP